MPGELITKEQLLTRIRDGYNTFNALLRSIRPGDQLMKLGDWTAAEHVAHVAAWEQLPLAVLTGKAPHEAMGISQAAWESDTDGINAALYELHRGASFDEARSMLSQVHASLVAAIELTTDEYLAQPLGDDDTVADMIAGNTYGHYEEHAGWMREGLGR